MPQRFLRPGLRTSEKWNAVSRDAQSLWLAILMVCDDYGRYDGRDSILLAEAFTVWNELNPEFAVKPQRIPALRSELTAKNLATFYEVDGKRFVQLEQWQERARGKSRWPDPKDGNPLRNPAESCGILPPSPLVIALSHESSPTPALAESPTAQGGVDLEKLRLRICTWFNRRTSTPWTKKEIAALKAVLVTSPDEIDLLERYYLEKIPYGQNDYRRRDPQTLLNNWPGEIDRARHRKGAGTSKPSCGPTRAEVNAYAKEKGDEHAVFAVSFFSMWEKREWKNNGKSIDWRVIFSHQFANHREKQA